MNKSSLDGEIISAWRKFLTELITLLFTANVFWSLYKGDGETSLIFCLLLIALQIEKVSDNLK